MDLPREIEDRLGRTIAPAGEAARAAARFLLTLDERISWKLNKSTIDFRAERQFCSLWPVKKHVTLWITKTAAVTDPKRRLVGTGRTANLKLASPSDFDGAVRTLLRQSFRSEELRPLASRGR